MLEVEPTKPRMDEMVVVVRESELAKTMVKAMTERADMAERGRLMQA